MSFFNQMGGGASPMLGGGGQASGLMGPGGGMNPQLMALLMAMQNRQGQPGAPMPGAAPQMPGAPQAMMPQMQAQPPAQGAPQGGLMALLAQMNPQMLQRLLSGGGGAGV